MPWADEDPGMLKPKKYRQKPVEVESMQWSGKNASSIANWLTSKGADDVEWHRPDHLRFQGKVVTFSFIFPGDWILSHSDETFEVLHDDEFRSKYDLIWPEPLPGV